MSWERVFMNKSKKVYKEKKASIDRSYLYIFTLISLPVLIVTIILTGVTIFSFINSTNKSKNESLSVLSESYSSCEESLNTAIAMSAYFADKNTVKSALTDVNWEYSDDITGLLHDFSNSLSYLDSAYIYNRSSKTIYSEKGKFSEYDFFSNIYLYDNYPAEYWNNLTFYYSEAYTILSPTTLAQENNDIPKSIIPIVIRKIDGIQQKNYLILNIDVKKILPTPTNDAVEVFVYNKFTNEIFYPARYSERSEMTDIDFLQNLSAHPNGIFKFHFRNESTIVSTFSSDDSVVGYTYFAIISLNKIFEHELPIIYTYIAIILIVLIFSVFSTLHTTNKIYNPAKRAKDSLDKMSISSQKEDSNIFEQIVSLSENIRHTESEVLSFAQEHYMVNMLNSTDYHIDKNSISALHSSFNFKYKFFAVVLIQLAPTSKFYDLYSQEVYFEIKREFYEIIKDLFSQCFINYILPAENDVLDIILNFDNESELSLIPTVFNEIYKLIESDRDCLNFSVGIGSICSNIEDIKKSHDAARYNFIVFEQPNIVAKISSSDQGRIEFDRSSEDVLYSALSSYEKDKILETISELFEKNKHLSGHSIKLLYNYILNVILKFIRINNIPYKNDMLDYEILDSLLKQPVKNIDSDLNNIIEIILTSKKETSTGEHVAESIMQYLLNNFYSPDISIKGISSKFGVSESTVSRIVTDRTGLGFRDFINMKRIEKAKNHLANTTMSIEEIYTSCGFISSRTFYRLFKTNVGQTPSEYAKAHKK